MRFAVLVIARQSARRLVLIFAQHRSQSSTSYRDHLWVGRSLEIGPAMVNHAVEAVQAGIAVGGCAPYVQPVCGSA